ncbi:MULTISPECIES: acyl-CoA dehydrogenase family protein [unclassified Pseudonocardia]|uniref:acyl-CoA dehydrogenase family protein n=1 Tax=unclassified Pseudonocardia TaxID=2619320 RepID=UPI0009636EB5|nr:MULTISPECIES: acyl-CoA dehydrogenase family protein [unclassified Pseudonocardia]MBN9097878.1 acyl-CoA/acyl-ACP dehydrogenase [Pseudonocardia sp.]OJY49118.1 MAG: acyl-CoA dehydrogenase [Pseudonocardia sp. 73-21]
MSFVETSEQSMIRETVAKIAGGFGHDYFVDITRRGEPALELWKALADAGFVAVNIPEEYGGGGQGITELAIVCEELAAAGCPMLVLIVSSGIAAPVIAQHGSAEQRQRWLPAMASGAKKMAFSITEPDAGLNTHKITTSAVRDGEDWRIRGTKYYASGIDEADQVLLVARTGVDEATSRSRLSLFVVDTDAPGLTRTVIPMELKVAEKQFFLHFDDVVVTPDRMIGAEGEGLRHVFTGLNPERITVAAVSAGIGRYALAKASRYANDRQVWDVPIGAHQGLAHPLAEAKIALELARLMTQKAGWLFDSGRDAGAASNMAKFAAADAGLRCLDAAIQIHGGNGMATEYGLADMWGMARLLRTAPVSREMILNYVSEHALGLPRSY